MNSVDNIDFTLTYFFIHAIKRFFTSIAFNGVEVTANVLGFLRDFLNESLTHFQLFFFFKFIRYQSTNKADNGLKKLIFVQRDDL
jgi:hypothetical protein